jgi:hypothetical protein
VNPTERRRNLASSLTFGLLTQKQLQIKRSSDPKSLLISNISTLQSGNEI